MPLSENSTTNETAGAILKTMQGAFSTPPGFRAGHARGILLTGTFTPSSEASSLTKAHHFNATSTPVTVRFSNGTGIPTIPDNDPNASPRGMVTRFHLPNTSDGKRAHTDIFSHSTAFFPTRNGELFLQFLQSIGGGTIGDFLATHPSAAAFVQDPKPAPNSFATEKFFGVCAYQMTAADGKSTFVRFRLTPDAGEAHLSAAEAEKRDPAYLHNEIQARVIDGPVVFSLKAQLAEEGDVTDDATIHWPNDRKVVELGKISIDKVMQDNDEEQRKIIFDPVPRGVDGLEASKDPLLDLRASVYLQGGRQRREAKMEA